MEQKTKFAVIFYILSVTLLVLSFLAFLGAFVISGFGSLFPLWGRLMGVFSLIWLLAQNRIKKFIMQTMAGNTSQKQVMLYTVKRAIFIVVIAALIVVWHCHAHQRYLQFLYAIFFSESIPENVKLINGNYYVWMDWRADLSFSTDQDTFNRIIEGYEVIPRDKITGSYFGGTVMDDMTTVFYNKEVPKKKRGYDDYLVAWSKSKKRAYVHGGNAFYGEALVATVDIPAGSVIGLDMFEVKKLGWRKIEHLALSPGFDNPSGIIAAKDISKGEQITYSIIKYK